MTFNVWLNQKYNEFVTVLIVLVSRNVDVTLTVSKSKSVLKREITQCGYECSVRPAYWNSVWRTCVTLVTTATVYVTKPSYCSALFIRALFTAIFCVGGDHFSVCSSALWLIDLYCKAQVIAVALPYFCILVTVFPRYVRYARVTAQYWPFRR